MARKLIRDLFVRLGVVAETTKAKDFDRAVDGAKRTMQGASAIALGLSGALIGLGLGLVSTTMDVAALGDQHAKAAARAGTHAEALQELDYAAQRSGAAQGVVEKALRRVAVVAYDAQKGLATAKDAFADVGITDTKKYGDTVDLLEAVADGMQGLDEQRQIALATKIFGRSGGDLLPLLQQGRDGIRSLREEGRIGVISNEAAAAGERFEDSMLNLRTALGGLRNEVGSALVPLLADAVDWLTTAAVRAKPVAAGVVQLIDKTVGLRFAIGALLGMILSLAGLGGLLGLASVAGVVVGAISSLWGVVAAGLPILGPLALFVLAVAGAFSTALIPVLLVGAAVLAVVLAFQDLHTWLQGGDSVFGALLNRLQKTHPEAYKVAAAFGEAVRFGWELAGVLVEIGRLLLEGGWAVVRARIQRMSDGVERLIGLLTNLAGFDLSPLLGQFASISRAAESAGGLFSKGRGILGGVRQGLGTITIPGDALVGSGSGRATNTTTQHNSVLAPINVQSDNPVDTGFQVRDVVEGLFDFGQAGLTGVT